MGEEDSSAPFEVQEVEEEEDAGNEEQDHNEVTDTVNCTSILLRQAWNFISIFHEVFKRSSIAINASVVNTFSRHCRLSVNPAVL